MVKIPEKDIETVENKHLCLVVMRKSKQGARWIIVNEIGSHLEKALGFAMNLNDFQVGVLVKTENGDSIYWTSKFPDLFNSSVLTHADNIRLENDGK